MRNLYDEWLHSKNEADRWKRTELELRNDVVAEFIKENEFGSFKFDDEEYLIKIVKGLSKSLDEATLETIKPNLSDEELNCLKYKPSLVAKELKELTGHELLFEAITEKPRQATLKITKK